MANNLSDYAEAKIIDHSVGKTSWTMPTAHIALYTTTPTDSTAGTEVTNANSYARLATAGSDWAAASAGANSNAADLTFTTASGSWGTVAGVAITDSATHGAGNIIWYGALTASKTVDSGDTFKFATGALTLALN